ncbi:Regulatory protein BlaR1 [Gimesia panareensis]|uniref:Regulatory protein BlaR1 n=1 Tax=Gimesia panareensis TaxID=2527978 RepID=A0A517Q9W4_9PLAN|nr:M56 family metallopeptidase [Gimesia panareensis]QDT28420.1 Regulatory protein BlaR1 [Gimesia panareensis]
MMETTVAYFAVHVLLQSTLLIAVGCLAMRFCGRAKPVVHSVILRVTLLAVLICPLVSLAANYLGATSYAMLPAWDNNDVLVTERISATEASSSPSLENGSSQQFSTPHVSTEAMPLPQDPGMTANMPVAGEVSPIAADNTTVPSESFVNEKTGLSLQALISWVVTLIWLSGALFLLTKLLRACHGMTRVVKNSQPAEAQLQNLCRETAERLELRPPEVRISPAVHSPCLTGIRKPLILLPAQNNLSDAVLRDIFLHELAHQTRRDCLYFLLARFATAVLFFQPLAWWLARCLEQLADDICDDYVIHYGSGRKRYANTLVDFAERLPAPSLATEAGLAMVSHRSALSRRVLRILDSSRVLTLRLPMKWVALILVLGFFVTTSAAVLVNARADGSVEKEDAGAQTDEDLAAAVKAQSTKQKQDGKNAGLHLRGNVVNPAGQPVPNASIGYVSTGMDQRQRTRLTTTDARGNFEITIPASDPRYAALHNDRMLVAMADGFGPAVESVMQFDTSGEMRKSLLKRIAASHASPEFLEQARKRIQKATPTLQLVTDDVPLTGTVVDIEGQPVTGARLQVTQLHATESGSLDDWEQAAQKPGADFYETRMLLIKSLGNDVGGATLEYIPSVVTDRNGRFTFKGLGHERIVKLLISGPGIATSYAFARTRQGKAIELPMQARNPSSETIVYHPSEFTHVAGPSLPVIGVVRDAKTRQPLPGVTLQSYHLAGRRVSGWSEGLVQAVTDNQGRYRLEGLPIGKNEVICLAARDQPHLLYKFSTELNAGSPPPQQDVELVRGVWATGRAYDRVSGEPIRGGRLVYAPLQGNPFAKSIQKSYALLTSHYRLQEDGTYRIPVLPGPGAIGVMANDHMLYQRGQGAEKLIDQDNPFKALKTTPFWIVATNYHVLAKVNPAEDAKSAQVDLPFDPGPTLRINVVKQDGTTSLSGNYVGMMEEFPSWNGFEQGQLEIRGYRSDHPRRVQVIDPESQQAGYLLISKQNPTDLKITLEPWAEITGRLVDESGNPKARVILSNVYQAISKDPNVALLPPNPEQKSGGTVSYLTDGNGRFQIRGMIPGAKYSIAAREIRKNGGYFELGDFLKGKPLQPGEVRDLGNIIFKRPTETN